MGNPKLAQIPLVSQKADTDYTYNDELDSRCCEGLRNV